MSFYRFLCQVVYSRCAITNTGQVSRKVTLLQTYIESSKTMITYNCTECGSWANQLLGRASAKGETTKFQLNQGPPTDMNCSHCEGRQVVRPSKRMSLKTACWTNVGWSPPQSRIHWKITRDSRVAGGNGLRHSSKNVRHAQSCRRGISPHMSNLFRNWTPRFIVLLRNWRRL
jgi:hypothetical protein